MPDRPVDERALLALVFAVTLTSIMGNSLLAPAIPDVLDEFGRSDSAGGLLIAATSLPGIVIAPVIGILADRYGRRRILTPCLAVFGTAGILVVSAPTFELVLAARFAMGFGAAGLVNLAITLLGDRFTGERRTYWIGKNAGVLTVGLAVFPLLSGVVTDLVGWRWALAPYGVGLITATAAWRILPADVGRHQGSVRDQLSGVGATLRNPTIRSSFMAAGLGFAAMFGVFLAVLPTHLENEFGLSAGWRGLVLGLPAVTSSVGAFNLTRIRARLGTGRLLMAMPLAWIVAFATMGLAGAIWLLLIGALLYGFGEGTMLPTMQDVALGETPDEQRAAVMATWTGFARLGQTSGPLLAGVVLAVSSTSTTLLFGALFPVAMAAAFVRAGVHRRP